MKNLKRILSLCLSLLLAIGCLTDLRPQASAASYSVWVLGTQITDDNKNDVLGDGTVSYNATYQILYLNAMGARVAANNNHGGAAIYADGDLTIVATGYNAVNQASFGVRTGGNLYVHGSGRLVAGGIDSGVYTGGTLYLDDEENKPRLFAEGGAYGIRARSAVLLQGTVSAQSFGQGVDSAVYANAGVYIYGGKLELGSADPRFFRNNLTLSADGSTGPAVYASGRIELSERLRITAPDGGRVSADRCTIQDYTGVNAKKFSLIPREAYSIIYDAYSCELLFDQGTTVFPGTSVTVRFRPEEEGLYLNDFICEGDDTHEPIPVNMEGESYSFIMPAEDVYIYAAFSDEPFYPITIDAGILHGSVSTDYPRLPEGEEVVLTLTPDASYYTASVTARTAKGESIQVQGEGSSWSFTMPAAAVTVSAEFLPNPHGITLVQDPHGTISADRETATLGELVHINAAPALGYRLDDVSVTDAGGNAVQVVADGGEYSFFMPDSSVTVAASYSGGLAVNLIQDDWGTISADVSLAAPGQTVTITAAPLSGWMLDHILVTYGNNEQMLVKPTDDTLTMQFTMPASAVSVKPVFAARYTVNVVQQAHGTVSASRTSATSGSLVTVTVSPDPGYRFTGSIQVKLPGGQDVYLSSDNTFEMPSNNVTVSLSENAFEMITYDLWLGGTQVTGSNCVDILSDGTASFDPETSTLTLNTPVSIEGYKNNALIYSGLPNLTILGSASIESGEKYGISCNAYCALTLDGSFTVSGTSNGIRANHGAVVLSGGSILIISSGTGYAITTTDGSLTIRDNIDRVEFRGDFAASSGSINLGPNVLIDTPAGGTISGGKFKDADGSNVKQVILVPREGCLPITVEQTGEGSVTLDRYAAQPGETVTLNATPADKYALDSLSVTDANGAAVTVTEGSFVMPDTAVTVQVRFAPVTYEIYLAGTGYANAWAEPSPAAPGQLVSVHVTPDSGYGIDPAQTFVECPGGIYLEWQLAEDDPNCIQFVMPESIAMTTIICSPLSTVRDILVADAPHGAISAPAAANVGETVTLTVTPDANYKLGALVVKDAEGNDVSLQQNGTLYTFTMPNSTVTVSGRFDVETYYDIYVGGVQANSLNKDDILGDGKVQYDPETQTLTLGYTEDISASLALSYDAMIYTKQLDYLTVTGDGCIQSSRAGAYGILAENTALSLNGTFRITASHVLQAKDITLAAGSCELYANGTDACGIRTQGTLTVTGEVTSLRIETDAAGDGRLCLSCGELLLDGSQRIKTPEGGTTQSINGNDAFQTVFIRPEAAYPIQISASEHGAVAADRTEAYEGESIALTITPELGYRLKTLTVRDANDNPVSISDNQFTMPASAVTVSAVFEIATNANDKYELWIGTTQVTAQNANDVLGDGKISYNPTTRTLHLENVEGLSTLTTYHGSNLPYPDRLIESNGDLTITGSGIIAYTGSGDVFIGISVINGDLTLDGDFELRSGEHRMYVDNLHLIGGRFVATGSVAISKNLILGDEQEYAEFNGDPVLYCKGVDMSRFMRLTDPAGVNINNIIGYFKPYTHAVFERVNGRDIHINAQNGTVTPHRRDEIPGRTVTLTLEPDEGFTLESITVTDENGNAVPLDLWDDQVTAQFTMPSTAVTVDAIFSDDVHAVQVATSQHGSISVEKLRYRAGETVAVTVSAESGYELKHLNVMPASGAVQDAAATLSFLMPDCDVYLTADFGVIYYPLTMSDDGHGSVTAGRDSAVQGDTVTLTVSPKTGYTLDTLTATTEGGDNVTVSNNQFTMPAAPVTVYAAFSKVPYHVNLDEGMTHGSVESDKQTATSGELVTLTVTPDAGYVLEYLSVSDAEGLPVSVRNGQFTMPASDVLVSATFALVPHQVTVNVTGPGSVEAAPQSAGYGQEVTLTATPDVGCELTTISAAEDAEGQAAVPLVGEGSTRVLTMPDADVVVTAVFSYINYPIVITPAEHGTVTAAETAVYGQRVPLTVTPETGYALDTLTITDENGNELDLLANNRFVMPTCGVTVTASFRQASYTVTVLPTTNGAVTASTAYAAAGDTVTLTITPNDGFALGNLSVLDSGYQPVEVTGNRFMMPAGNVIVMAQFVRAPYTVQIAPTEHGSVTALPEAANGGDVITLTVTPDEGYELQSLSVVDADGSVLPVTENRFTMPLSDVTVTAVFAPVDYTVTVLAPVGGTAVADRTTAHLGDTVTLTATPYEGNSFNCWTATCGEDQTVPVENDRFTMPAANVTVTAIFDVVNYEITIADTENGTVTADKSAATVGETVTLTVTPAEDYVLQLVTVIDANNNPVEVSGNQFTMPAAAVTVTATFGTSVQYVDAQGNPMTPVSDVAFLNAGTTELTEGWWVVSGNITNNNRLTVSGSVNLILCDGATLNATNGIAVGGNNSLTIWAQSHSDGRGKLTAKATNQNYAGIGSNQLGVGIIVINGGEITATGGSYGAGIGGGYHSTGGSITINNGKVSATGRTNAAGIGGGSNPGWAGHYGSLDTITITGGEVTATANGCGAGIGGGGSETSGAGAGNVNTITITGGQITASSQNGYGIGPGVNSESEKNNGLVGDVITFGWTEETDFIQSSRNVSADKLTFALGKAFLIDGEAPVEATTDNVQDACKLIPNLNPVLEAHSVTVDDGITNGTVTTDVQEAAFGDTVTITVTPDEGYELESLTVLDAENNEITVENNRFTMPASAVTVTATFKPISYTVTAAASENGAVTANKAAAIAGETVTVTVTPDEGYELESLSATDAENSVVELTAEENGIYTFTMPASNVTVTATFKTAAPVTYTYFVGQSLTLEGDIGVNFYVKLNDVDPADARVVFTWGSGSKAKEETVDISALTADASGLYKLTVRVAAAQMTDTITAKLYSGETEVAVKQYSVAQYARYILGASDETVLALVRGDATKAENLRALCKAMLIYGAKSQLHFKYQVYALADQGLSYTLDPVGELGTTVFPEDFETTTGLKYSGSSLVLESQTTYRLFFTVTDQAKFDSLTVKLGSDTLSYGTRGSYVYYDIANIPAANVLKDFTLTFGEITVTANAGEYMTKVFNGSDQTLQDAMTALYWYNMAAKSYFGVN